MAMLGISGFETLHIGAEHGLTYFNDAFGGVGIVGGVARTGTGSCRVFGKKLLVRHVGFPITGAFDRGYWGRIAFKPTILQAAGLGGDIIAGLIVSTTGLNSAGVRVKREDDGKLRAYYNTTQIGADGPTTNIGTWYLLEFYLKISAAGNDEAAVWIDNTLYGPVTAAITATAPAMFAWGHGISDNTNDNTPQYEFDDAALCDDTGSFNNGRLGDGAVRMLVPTSVTANVNSWLGGAGGAPAATAVDNKPPLGKAVGSSTDLTQITNSAAGARVKISTST